VADSHGDDHLNNPARSGDDHRPDRRGTKPSTKRPKLNNQYSADSASSSAAAMHSMGQAADVANEISGGSSSFGRYMATDARKKAQAAVSGKGQRQTRTRPRQVGKKRGGLAGGRGQSPKATYQRPVAAREVNDDPKSCVALIYRIFKDWDLKKTVYVIVILAALTVCLVALTLVQGAWPGNAVKLGSYAKKGAVVTTALGFVGSVAGVVVKVRKKRN
jgi:hypothetical protein